MNGKVDARGYLYIERSGTMKCQACPFEDRDGGQGACGDWCPLFGEPRTTQQMVGLDDMGIPTFKDGDGATVEICHNRNLEFLKFTDERVK